MTFIDLSSNAGIPCIPRPAARTRDAEDGNVRRETRFSHHRSRLRILLLSTGADDQGQSLFLNWGRDTDIPLHGLPKAVKENGGGVVHHTVWDEELSKERRQPLVQVGKR